MKTYPTLYQYDVSGRLRVWFMEQAGDSYRSISGLKDGAKVESDWKKAKAKNVGRSNATTAEQQAESEINSQYTSKLKSSFYYTEEEASQGSRFFEPMLAGKYDPKKIRFPCFNQPKLDGFRCIGKIDGLFSRNGEQFISSPHILEELKPIFEEYPRLVFDGELYNHSLREDFNKIASMVRKTVGVTPIVLAETAELVEYHIYDIYNPVTPETTFNKRNEFIRELFEKNDFKKLVMVPTLIAQNQAELDESYGLFLQEVYEGQMIRYDTPYENKRTNNLLKRKEFMDGEFEVLDIEEGLGNWAGKAKSILLKITDQITCSAGIRGTEAYLQEVWKNKEKYIGGMATVRYQNKTPDGKLRFPVVTDLNRSM